MNPFSKAVADLQPGDILSLIESGVPEGLHIDYKRQLPELKIPESKGAFLDDVAAFANGRGGCVVYGLDDNKGVPTRIVDLGDQDFDQLKLQMEEILRTHLEPRLAPPAGFNCVETEHGKVFVVYVPQSWKRPHMVVFPSDRFVIRGAAGNRRMDVEDLRGAFLDAEAPAKRIQEFRLERLSRILTGETPFPLQDRPGTQILHVVPLAAFATEAPAPDLVDLETRLQPFYKASFNGPSRLNLDGLAATYGGSDNGGKRGYMQLFRNGIIEFVSRWLILDRESQKINSKFLERFPLQWLQVALELYREIGVEPPMAVMMSLLNVRGCRMSVSSYAENTLMFPELHVIDRADLLLPPVVVHAHNTTPGEVIHGLADLVWQAAGWPASKYFNEDHELQL